MHELINLGERLISQFFRINTKKYYTRRLRFVNLFQTGNARIVKNNEYKQKSETSVVMIIYYENIF